MRRGITSRLSFLTALRFFIVRTDDLSFLQSDYVCQLYAVLCLAFLGVDRYFEKQKPGLYTISVFLMILTSFYFSIGGMFALVLYVTFIGIPRAKEKLWRNIKILGFVSDGLSLPFTDADGSFDECRTSCADGDGACGRTRRRT